MFKNYLGGAVNYKSREHNRAFTIVELLVVIVVIGIMAAIVLISYTGVQNKAVMTSLALDLNGASKQLALYYTDHGTYPTSLDVNNCPLGSAPSPDTKYCIKPSSNTTFTYKSNLTTIPQTFALTATKSGISYITANNTTPAQISANPNISCPAGFIPVPGSIAYGTADFCVMKYEAKQADSITPISRAAGMPWVNINQNDAATYSKNVAGCAGCHLITEAEWLTIAQNVLSVPGNWSTGTVGSGYIYSGHNDNAPANALAADSNDANGYAGETNTGGNQRRTLMLTNGQVIWDMAGNDYEWTSGTLTNGQPGIIGETGYGWKEWNSTNVAGSLSPSPFPSYANPAAGSWGSSQGIGLLCSYNTDVGLRGFIRGGSWYFANYAGVFMLNLTNSPDLTHNTVTFRVAM